MKSSGEEFTTLSPCLRKHKATKLQGRSQFKTQPVITCSKLTLWGRSSVFIVNFERISHLVLVFLLSPLSS